MKEILDMKIISTTFNAINGQIGLESSDTIVLYIEV